MKIKGICRQCEERQDDCILSHYEGDLVVFCRSCAQADDIRSWDETLSLPLVELIQPLSKAAARSKEGVS